jgi:hypothetical protein
MIDLIGRLTGYKHFPKWLTGIALALLGLGRSLARSPLLAALAQWNA